MMYELSKTNQFKKDFKLIEKRNYDISKLETALTMIITGDKLPSKYKEHPLIGNYQNHFECHIQPDWLLIFKRDNSEKLITLVRTGTHSDLFG